MSSQTAAAMFSFAMFCKVRIRRYFKPFHPDGRWPVALEVAQNIPIIFINKNHEKKTLFFVSFLNLKS